RPSDGTSPRDMSRPPPPDATTATAPPGADVAVRAIRCGTLFDGTGAPPVRDAVVVVDEGRIAAVGRAGAVAVPPAAAAVDLGDRFVMPGLIDCHTHASIVPGLGDQLGQLCRGPVPQALAATANLRADLAAGTTTMRVMGEEHFLDIDVRDAIDAGVIAGPRLLVAGRGLAANNGHGGAGLRLAVEEGVGTIEHGLLAGDEDVALMVERRVWLICTFSIFMHPTGIEQGDGQRPAIMDKVRWARRVVDESFPRHLASGVRFACGTDSMHGLMPVELETLVRF